MRPNSSQGVVPPHQGTDAMGGLGGGLDGWSAHGSSNLALWDWGRQLDHLAREKAFTWYLGIADWKYMISATFRWKAGPDTARHFWRALVAQSNMLVFGKHYTRKVGHSYFSYLVGYELQEREAFHFHALVGSPIYMSWTQHWLSRVAGWAWVERCKSQQAAVRYCTKYIIKGGDVTAYRTEADDRLPEPLPSWWS